MCVPAGTLTHCRIPDRHYLPSREHTHLLDPPAPLFQHRREFSFYLCARTRVWTGACVSTRAEGALDAYASWQSIVEALANAYSHVLFLYTPAHPHTHLLHDLQRPVCILTFLVVQDVPNTEVRAAHP